MLANLHGQRQNIQHAQATLDGVNADLDTADGKLKAMARRQRFLG